MALHWPKVNARESFRSLEKRLGIEKEMDDVRKSDLGEHPSVSFFSKKQPEGDLDRMRGKFDKAASRY